jgi:hypothetical protein
MRTRACLLACLAGVVFLSGCGRAGMARVHGRVTCQGKPVPEAAVIFSPVAKERDALEAGKAAQGGTDEDGRYTLTTYRSGDGALIGKHKVSVVVDNTVRLPCQPKVVELEVKPGDNELDIELGK